MYLDCGHEILAVSIAAGYTKLTGRMQVVLLHAGAGLLQGSMAIFGARLTETPMLVLSGESQSFGEGEFDPGPQWYRSLNVVGGPQRLVEPVVKIALQTPSVSTLYQSVVRAGELAQHSPQGPTYVCVSMESMIESWSRPTRIPYVPAPPKLQPATGDIARVAEQLSHANCPFIFAESVGGNEDAFRALAELAELLAIPVIDAPGAAYPTFPNVTVFISVSMQRLTSMRSISLCWSRTRRHGFRPAMHRATPRLFRSRNDP